MQLRNDSNSFGWLSVLLHWLIVALIITQFVLVHFAQDAEKAHSLMGQIAWLARHKSTGITILGLATLRLVWRWWSPPPALPVNMPPWQALAANASHFALYGLLFALPLTGWATSSAANFAVSYFGLFSLPNLVAPSDTLKDTLQQVHGFLAGTLLAVVSLHVVAALKHHFIDHDGVLLRIFGKPTETNR